MQINKIISFSGIEILIIQKCDLLIITNNVNVGWKLCSKVLTLKDESVKNITSLKMAVIFCSSHSSTKSNNQCENNEEMLKINCFIKTKHLEY